MPTPRQPYLSLLRATLFFVATIGLWATFDTASPRLPVAVVERALDGPTDRRLLRRADGRVLYLGDSVVAEVAGRDADRRPLHAMFADELGREVVVASHPANAMDTYLAQIDYVVAAGVRPALIVVPVNLRSFGPGWESNRRYNFRRKNRMYRSPLLTRALAVFKWTFESPIDSPPSKIDIWVGGRRVGDLASVIPAGRRDAVPAIRGRYLVQYAADVGRSRNLGQLRHLIRLVRDRGLAILVYLTPIDWQAMEEFLTPAERQACARNLAVLRDEVNRPGVLWIDLARAASANQFDHPRWNPHEHLNESGRSLVAQRLAARVRTASVLADGEPSPAGRR